MRIPKFRSWIFATAIMLAPTLASARVPLSEQPAVRHKLELRKFRFEISPTFEMSIASDYKTVTSAGAKAEFHLSDWLSFGGAMYFGKSANSGLGKQILKSLPDTSQGQLIDPTPSKTEYLDHLNETPLHGSAHATLTPWFGKMTFFSRLNVNFDVYFQGGLGFAQTTNNFANGDDCTSDDGDPRNDCPHNAGFNLGIMAGAGIHLFLNDFIALDLSFHNYFYSDNPSGLDFDGDLNVDSDDTRFMGHMFFGLGLSFYLSPTAKRSP